VEDSIGTTRLNSFGDMSTVCTVFTFEAGELLRDLSYAWTTTKVRGISFITNEGRYKTVGDVSEGNGAYLMKLAWESDFTFVGFAGSSTLFVNSLGIVGFENECDPYDPAFTPEGQPSGEEPAPRPPTLTPTPTPTPTPKPTPTVETSEPEVEKKVAATSPQEDIAVSNEQAPVYVWIIIAIIVLIIILVIVYFMCIKKKKNTPPATSETSSKESGTTKPA